MKTLHLQIRTWSSTGLRPDLDSVHTLGFEDHKKEGGFGAVHRLIKLNGSPVQGLVVKLLNHGNPTINRQGFETTQQLQAALGKTDRALLQAGETLLGKYPALAAVPQASFEATLSGVPVLGYLMTDAVSLGMEFFGDLMEDQGRIRALRNTPLEKRMAIAEQLVLAFELLSQIKFIHADLKPAALFVDLQNARCAVIDFDGGRIVQDATQAPMTFGTRQPWLAPEILKQLGKPTQGKVKVTLLADLWSVAYAIHYLLTGTDPLFFLREVSPASVADYTAHYRWPEAGLASRYVDPAQLSHHGIYKAYLDADILPALLRHFAATIHGGYDMPARRPSYFHWRQALASRHTPEILAFTANRVLVDDSRPVHLQWEVRGAKRLLLSGVGDVTGTEGLDVAVTRDTTFELILEPHKGQPIRRSVRVEVSRAAPMIAFFTSDRPMLLDRTPAVLSWKVGGAHLVTLDAGIGEVPSSGNLSLFVERETGVTLRAVSLFGVVATARVQLAVAQQKPVIHHFSASPNALEEPAAVELAWRVYGAETVRISDVGLVANCTETLVQLSGAKTFHLIATSLFGCTATATVNVTLFRRLPVIRHFLASPVLAYENTPVKLEWVVSNAAEVTIEPDLGTAAPQGECFVKPEGETIYTLRARSFGGTEARRSVRVRVMKRTPAPASPSPTLGTLPTRPRTPNPSTAASPSTFANDPPTTFSLKPNTPSK